MVWLKRSVFTIFVFFSLYNLSYAENLSSDEKVVFNFVDLDNDDKLSHNEIDDSIKLIFQLVDINRDGFISKTEIIELKAIIESLK